jgi:hypothetical protein
MEIITITIHIIVGSSLKVVSCKYVFAFSKRQQERTPGVVAASAATAVIYQQCCSSEVSLSGSDRFCFRQHQRHQNWRVATIEAVSAHSSGTFLSGDNRSSPQHHSRYQNWRVVTLEVVPEDSSSTFPALSLIALPDGNNGV